MTLTSVEFAEFISELTPKRFELLRLALKETRSISELAAAVSREQSAVSKDVGRLRKLGLVRVDEVSNAGHGNLRQTSSCRSERRAAHAGPNATHQGFAAADLLVPTIEQFWGSFWREVSDNDIYAELVSKFQT